MFNSILLFQNSECGFLVTWQKKDDNKVEFEMFASLEEDQGYVALGIAPSGLMVRFLVTLLFPNIRWLLAEPSFRITSCL